MKGVLAKNFISHFNIVKWIRGDRNSYNRKYRTIGYRLVSVILWVLLIPINILDLLGVFILTDTLRRVAVQTRKLTEFELAEARKVFGDTLNYSMIRIRENSAMARRGAQYAKKNQLGFVLFRTVNFSRKLDHDRNSSDMPWLIHELTHVLQFRYIGTQYILEALRAQRNAGYNYQGVKGLQRAGSLEEFNLEQQADIIKHYYQAINQGGDVDVYIPFVEDVKEGKF